MRPRPNRTLRRTLAWLALSVCFVSPALAQTKVGTSMGQFMLIEPSARFAGMGNTGVTARDEVLAAYYNAAAIGSFDRYAAQFTHARWFAGIQYDHAAVAIPLGGSKGSMALSLTSLNSGDIEVRTVNAPLGTGERFRVSDVAFGLGYGRRITTLFSLGVQIHYVQESVWNTSARTMVMSAGTLYRLGERGLEIGSSLNFFGTGGRFSGRDLAIRFDADPDVHGDNSTLPAEQSTGQFPVPVLFRVGLGLPLRPAPEHELRLAIDAFHPSDNTESVSFGGEWSYRQLLALRAGYQNLFMSDSELGLTACAGFRARVGDTRLKADYAWAA
ncbi:MAG: PorV/PorQ family protein, partial [Candidatus Eisenbacteria bacterium]